MSLELVPKSSPYYDGSHVVFVDNDHFIHSSGANLRVTNAKNGETAGFVFPTEKCPRGISAYTANPKRGLLAIAKRCRPPTIDIVAWPGKGASQDNAGPPFLSEHLAQELKATAVGGAALEYGCVAISRKGERLAAISVLADYILTVWDIPNLDSSEQLDYTDARAPQAQIVASIVLPCVCDSISFNPANPSMLAVTATSAHHDGVGGGHAGGLFLYNISSSHGHTSLVLTEAKIDEMPDIYDPRAIETGDADAMSSRLDYQENEAAKWDEDGHVGDGHGEEEDEEMALHRGYHPHAGGNTSVNVAIWGPNDVVYVGTTAGVVGKFYGVTGEFLQCWNRGLDNGSVPSAVVGLVLTKNFLVVASRARMLYWLNLKTFNTVEHTATIFGIRTSNPPERVAQLTYSPNFRSLLVTTMEGTMHEHTVEPPADPTKRSVVTGIPDILPILLDYHEAFVLCCTSTHLALPSSDNKAPPGATEEAELYLTGGSDGNLRVWWASDGAPATSKSYRALKPSEPQEVSEYDSNEDNEENDGNTLGDEQDRIEALGDGGLDDLDENAMVALSEDGSEASDDGAPEDPFEMPAVPVTALATMPGRPVIAVGLADGELSLLFVHDETFLKDVGCGESFSSDGSQRSRNSRASDRNSHPSGTNLTLMPLDLKQLCRKPITHLTFFGGGVHEDLSGLKSRTLLAVGSSIEGSVHIIEVSEPDAKNTDMSSPQFGTPASDYFKVIARFEVGGASNHMGGNSQFGTLDGSLCGSLAGSVGGSRGPRLSSLTWSSFDTVLAGTSDGAIYAYAINTGIDLNDYNPNAIANSPPRPLALLRDAKAKIDPLNGGSGLTATGDDDGDVSPITNLIVIPEQPHAECAIEKGTLVAISPAGNTPVLFELPPIGSQSLQKALIDILQPTKSTTKKKNGKDKDLDEEDLDELTGDEDEEGGDYGANELASNKSSSAARSAKVKVRSDKKDDSSSSPPVKKIGFNGMSLLNMPGHPSVFNNYVQQGHPLGIGCISMCNPEAGQGDGSVYLASGGLDGSIILWKVSIEGLTRVSDFQVHSSPILSLVFSPSGSSILSVDLNRAVMITSVQGLFPASLIPSGVGPTLSSRVASGVTGGDENEAGDADSVGDSMASPSKTKSGYAAVALLRRASSTDAMNRARQQEKMMGGSDSASRKLSSAEDQMRSMLAMSNLNGPLPAPHSVMTWVEAATTMVTSSSQTGPDSSNNLTGDNSLQSSLALTKDTSRIMDLAIRLEDLLVKNDNASDLEKLPRELFVVDVKRRDAAIAINKARAARVREETEDQDAARDLISARILAVCEGGMEVKAKEVKSMKKEHCSVPNLPVPERTKLKSRALECMQRLRMVEIKEIRYAKKNFMKSAATTNGGDHQDTNKEVWLMPREIPSKLSWVVNQGTLVPKIDVLSALQTEESAAPSKDKKDGGDGDNDGGGEDETGAVENNDESKQEDDGDEEDKSKNPSDETETKDGKGDKNNNKKDGNNNKDASKDIPDVPLDPKDILSYIYPPTCLRTNAQRRSQIVFLGELVRNIKLKFNLHVDKLSAMKMDEMEKIQERNHRIEAICKDLEIENDCFVPVLQDVEKPECFLVVDDEEMETLPYETEEIKEKKRKIEADRIARENASKKDDMGTRALMDMMYGSLETKKEGALEKTLEPMPDWMSEMVEQDILSEMTDEQRDQYDDYLLKVEEFEKAKQAEKDLLLEEMAHLKTEVNDIVTHFDEKVSEIQGLRVHAQIAVATQELYMMRLGVGLEEGESLTEVVRLLEISKYKVNVQKVDLDEQASKWHKQVHEAKEQLALLHEEDIRLEKTFRKSLAEISEEPITNDIYKIYLSLFKLRRDNAAQTGSGVHGSSNMRSSKANRRPTQRSTIAKPSLMAAAGSLMGARRQTSKGVGFMGLLKAASKDDEAKIQAEAADPFSELDAAGTSEPETIGKKSGSEASSAKRLAEAAEQAAYAPLDFETDIPDGFKISAGVWERLQNMRIDKIKNEINIRKLSKKVNEMTKSTENIDKRDDHIAQELSSVEYEIAELDKRRSRNSKDFEVIAQLRQGQNELMTSDLSFLTKLNKPKSSSKLSPCLNENSSGSSSSNLKEGIYPKLSIDMKGGILIDADHILQLNEQIKAVGAEKVKALNKIKHFRKSINYMTWEDKYMSAKLQDLEEFYTDLLLLRVEKSTLQAMRGDGNSVDPEELAAKHEKREEMTKSAFAVKVQRQLAANNKISQQIQDRRLENEKLRDQLSQLEGNIKVREAIYRARVPGGGDDQAMAARMKKVTMRRRLVDLARVQTEEIDFLRGELDRLRQRTFPSFAHAAKHRLQLPPDEII